MRLNFHGLNKVIRFFKTAGLIVVIFFGNGCKKFVDVVAPSNSVNGANVYENDATAAAVLTGIYASMSSANITQGGLTSVSFLSGLSADELTLFNGVTNARYIGLYTNQLTSSNTGSDFWRAAYPVIFTLNTALEGIQSSQSLSSLVKTRLIGEAKFMRAFCYFYLTNLYGDVPLVLFTDYKENTLAKRAAKADVYRQMIKDLQDAKANLSSSYVKSDIVSSYPTGTAEKIRPNKWAAQALLARVYLYQGEYAKAEEESTEVITSGGYLLGPLADVFKKNSAEAIWQLQPVTTNPSNTWDARLYVLPTTGPNTGTFPVYLRSTLIGSFEAGDLRRVNWTASVTVGANTYVYANKYKINQTTAAVSEYQTILRLGELFLIRAEARLGQNNLSGALSDLNVIRARASLPAVTTSVSALLSQAIIKERQVELFTEWGHRWLDLKRTGQADPVMSVVTPQKGGVWETTDQLYPIPLSEIQKAHNLSQNPGY